MSKQALHTDDAPSAIIRNSHQQAAPAAIYDFGVEHRAAHEAALTGSHCTEVNQASSIFIAKWKQKQQVFYPKYAKPLKCPGKRWANSLQ